MSNKQLILDAARELFNRQGTAHVTTNYIAEGAGVSPGNLYYHYKDKAHIIRALYEQMILDWDVIYERIKGKDRPLDIMQFFVQENFGLLWQYRFFYREMAALLKVDEELAQRHTSVSRERYRYQRAILEDAVESGVLVFPSADDEVHGELDDALTTAWIIANYYLNHLEVMGRTVEKSDFEDGGRLVMRVFLPYIRDR